jgi:DNA-binding LacI/PurR family transcriptional regulator
MATIKDVAARAGVSIATVSRVLNRTGTITAQTREKVLQAVEELGYRINLTAKSLKTGKTAIIGIVISGAQFMETPSVVHSALVELQAHHFAVEVILDASLQSCVTLMKEGRLDGLLLVDLQRDDAALKGLIQMESPFVLLGGDTAREDVNLVAIDFFGGGYGATKHLISQGHRDILFTEDNPLLPYTQEIKRGYLFALDENGIPYSEDLLRGEAGHRSDKERIGYNSLKILNGDSENTTSPGGAKVSSAPCASAMLLTHDRIAHGALSAAGERGIAVPEELSVVGFGNHPYSSYLQPQLSSVKVPYTQQGELGAEILVNNILRQDSIVKRVTLQTQLIQRHTVAPHPRRKRS